MIGQRKLFECGGCGFYHPIAFDGDCRDDRNRIVNLLDTDIIVDEVEGGEQK